MKMLLPEKRDIYLRASVCDICNFSCLYCPSDLGMENHTPYSMNAPLLNADEYIRNMRIIAKHGFKKVSFTGGEPLLNSEFPYILKKCREIFETIEITTNGTSLIENIEIIKKNIDRLKISIDAITPDLQVKIARNQNAVNTTHIIEECCRAGIKTIGFNFVYMKQNENELPLLIDFAQKLTQKYEVTINVNILDLYYSEMNKDFWKEQFIALSDVRKQLIREGVQINQKLRIGCDSYNYLDGDIIINMKDSFTVTHRDEICDKCEEYCQEGIYSLKHSASGWISVCPSNNEKLGHLLDKNIDEEAAHKEIDSFIEILNKMTRREDTGKIFQEFWEV